MSTEKTHCKHCNVEILQMTYDRTNGYCMPHAYYGWPFIIKNVGNIEQSQEVDPEEILNTIPKPPQNIFPLLGNKRKSEELIALIEQIIPGDKLIHFSTRPSSRFESRYVVSGYAIEKDGKWIDGIVLEYGGNKDYHLDEETEIPVNEFAQKCPEIWNDWKNEFKEGDTIVHYSTSPFSWRCLCGRAGFAIKRNGTYYRTSIYALN